MAMEHNNQSIICPVCSCANPAKAKFCLDCGSRLSGQTKSNSGVLQVQPFNHSEAFNAKYEIIEKIGEGGMSVVYKAIQKNIQKTIAIKILKESLLHDQDSIQRFHEEARNAGALKHPNIIPIYDEGEIDNIHYIAMEYLYGVDFHDYIHQNGTLDENRFKEIFIQLADALQYLENHKLTHRDVKSANIFITKEGKPVLMDFGIASQGMLTSSTLYETNYGTPEYMSPEQIKGNAIDSRSDLFSLGVVMYEALTGKLPFKGAIYSDTLNLILNEEPDMGLFHSLGISPKLEFIIQKLLKKEPADRFQHASEVTTYLLKRSLPVRSPIISEKFLKVSIYLLSVLIAVSGIIIFKPWLLIINSSPSEKSKNISTNNNQQDKGETNTGKSSTIKTDDFIKEENPSSINHGISFENVPQLEAPSDGNDKPNDTKKNRSGSLSDRDARASTNVEKAKKALYEENNPNKAIESANKALEIDPESQIAKEIIKAAEEKKQEGEKK